MSAGGQESAAGRYLAALAAEPIPRTAKGFLRCGPTTARALAGAGQTVGQAGLVLPLAVLRMSALDHNIDLMRRWACERGARLAPHVKTTMAPQIMARQLAAGAWALTVANCTQAQVCVDLGAPVVLIANEVADAADIAWLAAQLSEPAGPRLICYVDSQAGVSLLADGLREHQAGRPLDVLVELGAADRRAGCRTIGQVMAVAGRASAAGLRVCGAGGFEGVITTSRAAADLARVDAFCDLLHDAADALAGEGLAGTRSEPVILTAAGSIYFDRVAARLGRPFRDGRLPLVVLRSGGYVSHDHGHLRERSPLVGQGEQFLPALQVRAAVLSIPQHDLAIVGAGRRDVGTDAGLPAVTGRLSRTAESGWQQPRDLYLAGIYDQHACLRRRGGGDLRGELAVADTVSLGISHPCTTFDRWRHLIAVDDQDRIVDVVRTFFW